MAVREWITNWLARVMPSSVLLSGMDYMLSEGRRRPADYSSLCARYSSWVYLCASRNGAAVASVPLRLYVRGGTRRFPTRELQPGQRRFLQGRRGKAGAMMMGDDVEEVLQHPLLDLLDRPNGFMTGRDLIELTVIFEELTGNAYWWLTQGQLGTVGQVWPMFPQWTKIVPDAEAFVRGYKYGKSEQDSVFYDEAEVVHFRYPNPNDAYYGMGPLQAALSAVDRSRYQGEYEEALYRNHGRPDGLVSVARAVTPEQKRLLEEQWREVYGGTRNAGKVAFLWGDMKFSPLNFSPRDAGVLASAKYSREEIADIFGLPPTKLEISQARAEAEAGNYSYMAETIAPKCTRLEDQLNEELAPLYDERLFVAFDDCVPQNRELRLKEIDTRLSTGLTTINEERAMEGLPPVDWGEVPLQLQSRGEAEEPAAPEAPEPGNEPGDDDEEPDGEGFDGGNGETEGGQKATPPFRHTAGCGCGDCQTRALDPLTPAEESFAEALRKVTRRQLQDVLQKLGIDATPEQVLAGWAEWAKDYYDAGKGPIKARVNAGGIAAEEAAASYGYEVSWEITHPDVIEWLEGYTMKFAEKINDTLGGQLKDAIGTGIQEGEGMPQLQERVQSVMGDEASAYRSEMIARTETHRAYQQGELQMWRESGIECKKTWQANADSCDLCASLDGTEVDLNEMFFEQGETYAIEGVGSQSFDYEAVDGASLHPNCLLPGTPVTALGVQAAYRAPYRGLVVQVTLADGRRLAVTPNHMLLTPRGFAPAHLLREGDYVVDGSGFEREVAADPNDDYRPSLVEEVFHALRESGAVVTRGVPVAAEYLHGDGKFVKGEIEVVATNGLLRGARVAAGGEHVAGDTFYAADVRSFGLSGSGALADFLVGAALAADSIVGGRREPAPFFGRRLGHPGEHPLASVPGSDAGVSENEADGGTLDPEGGGQRLHRLARSEPLQDGGAVNGGLALLTSGLEGVSHRDAHLEQAMPDGASAEAETLAECCRRFAGQVGLTKIIGVDLHVFAGHVYDLQTVSSLYICNGVLSSNCRCAVIVQPVESSE
jgi:HK97 family phage portal protein